MTPQEFENDPELCEARERFARASAVKDGPFSLAKYESFKSAYTTSAVCFLTRIPASRQHWLDMYLQVPEPQV